MKGFISKIIKKILLLMLPVFILRLKLRKSFGVSVFIFHDIYERDYENYEKLIKFISKHFQIITPAEFESFMDGEFELSKEGVLISFDDGFLSSQLATAKFLEPNGIKAAFFACPDFVKVDESSVKKFMAEKIANKMIQEEEVEKEQYSIDSEELQAMIERGHKIGCHTATHRRISELESADELHNEIVKAADDLEELVAGPVDWFAYPYGNINSVDEKSLKSVMSRYKFCFSGVRGRNTPKTRRAALRRDCVTIANPLNFNKLVCVGGLGWAYRKARKMLDHYAVES